MIEQNKITTKLVFYKIQMNSKFMFDQLKLNCNLFRSGKLNKQMEFKSNL